VSAVWPPCHCEPAMLAGMSGLSGALILHNTVTTLSSTLELVSFFIRSGLIATFKRSDENNPYALMAVYCVDNAIYQLDSPTLVTTALQRTTLQRAIKGQPSSCLNSLSKDSLSLCLLLLSSDAMLARDMRCHRVYVRPCIFYI